jgi:hypothetical protein
MFIYIARRSLRIENKIPFRKCSMTFTVHMLQYYWTNSKVLLQKCPVNSQFALSSGNTGTTVQLPPPPTPQKWSIALTVCILWAVNTYCAPNRARCCMQWRISWRVSFSVPHTLPFSSPIRWKFGLLFKPNAQNTRICFTEVRRRTAKTVCRSLSR